MLLRNRALCTSGKMKSVFTNMYLNFKNALIRIQSAISGTLKDSYMLNELKRRPKGHLIKHFGHPPLPAVRIDQSRPLQHGEVSPHALHCTRAYRL